ncbi:MAG: peptidoglycan glycosyltransferase [Desulfovibrio sp.]|nr:peptidoglycan glycosyltransferase [Desulfovibrio sp.]
MSRIQRSCRFTAASLVLCLLTALPASAAAPLGIVNDTTADLLNLRLDNGREVSFIRLDMPPGGQDDMENPQEVCDIRADFGLGLANFHAVPLKEVQRLVFCAEHPACLKLERPGHAASHLRGKYRSLLPQPGDTPVCHFEQFRPGMTMEEVCTLLPADTLRDDNDAILTSLGFAGQLWAARLSPAHPQSTASARKGGPATLGHLELRQPLSGQKLQALMQHLYRQGYAPWQAELPGIDMDFAEMADLGLERHKSLLEEALRHLMEAGTGEATVMLAPAAMLPLLADADAPQQDVQLFTLTLRQTSRTLIVDVAAYQAGKQL